jgi:molybdopterin-guanine dinucleotide biosynthesis protein
MTKEDFLNYNTQEFKSKDDEIAYLKSVIAGKTEELANSPESTQEAQENIVSDILRKYRELPKSPQVHEQIALDDSHITTLALGLEPEEHDEQIQKLIDIFISSGIVNTFEVLDKLKNDHLSDDFHRFLVQYVQNYESPQKFGGYRETKRSVERKLFEIVMQSKVDEKERVNDPKQLIALMERFYAGMLSITNDGKPDHNKEYFSIEVAKPQGSSHIRFFVSVPIEYVDLLQKQILALYPKAKVLEHKNDFNVFIDNGQSAGAYGKSFKTPALPIKRYSEFTADPIAVIVSALSKMESADEGAALQIVMRPSGEKFLKEYGKMLDKVKNGESLKKILENKTVLGFAKNTFMDVVVPKDEKKEKKVSYADEEAIKLIGEKLNSTIMDTNIRLVVSSQSVVRSHQILGELSSYFKQFTETKGNSIFFEEIKHSHSQRYFKHFIYRYFDEQESFPLNLQELATICHFPEGVSESDFSELKQYESKQAPAPMELCKSGVLMGLNKYRGIETKVFYGKEDRVRHFYCIGQTGTGKTTLLRNMIVQDIKNGEGVCFIDPHGSDIQDILANIPKERIDDVIYFDPADVTRPMGLNMLEYDHRFPEQKIYVVNELLAIFNKLFDMKVAGGPMFEQYFRNAAMLVMEHPESGNTLLEISRVMADSSFRRMKLEHCKNPLVKQFWKAAEETSGEQGLENYVPYVTSKFDGFLSNDIMRPIVVQEKSAFNFLDIMDSKKIFLVNLSKGRLGELNANLLGLILVGKIFMAALTRDPKDNPPDFYLYIDEFQNVTTDSIAQILSEARKYRLSLNIAHQYISQLQDNIKNAVFGNVGSFAVFRVSSDDAQYLEKQFLPTFNASDIMRLENRNAYMKLLADGTPQKPFNMVTLAPDKGNKDIVSAVKELSSLKYGNKREEVEEIIMKKFDLLN